MNDLYTYDTLADKQRPAWMVEAVDRLLAKVKKQNLWKIVDFCIDIWAKRYPKEHKEYLKALSRYRANRKNEYGATKNKAWRELGVIPPLIYYLLNKIAFDKIEVYGKTRFYREFAKRYPGFRGGTKF
jgi:hypothetical protein